MSVRRTRQSYKKKPNPAYYVGYVEDDETTDMIMKKFAELEKIQQKVKEEKAKKKAEAKAKTEPNTNNNNNQSSKSGKAELSDNDEPPKSDSDEPLTMDQLQSVFRNTSMYSMNSLKRNNEIFFDKPMISEDGYTIALENADISGLLFDVDYEVCEEDMLAFFPQDDSDYFDDGAMSEDDYKRSSTRKRSLRMPGTRRTKRKQRLPGYRNTSAFSSRKRRRRRAKIRHAYDIDRQKYPKYPVPRSWGMSVEPFQSEVELRDMKNFIYEEGDILSMKHEQYANGKTYTGIILDPPFDLSVTGIIDKTPGTISLKEFESIPIPKLMPVGGIIFVWTPTELIPEMINICERWSFVYVENAQWVMKDRRGGVCNKMTNCFTKCTDNLLLFRKTKDISAGSRGYHQLFMLHQRTPDVFFDYIRYHPSTGQRLKSKYQYSMVEEMIWCFFFKDQINLLYLWAPKNERRPGWHMVCDVKQQQFLVDTNANVVNQEDEGNIW